jgi:hypothetical protein
MGPGEGFFSGRRCDHAAQAKEAATKRAAARKNLDGFLEKNMECLRKQFNRANLHQKKTKCRMPERPALWGLKNCKLRTRSFLEVQFDERRIR